LPTLKGSAYLTIVDPVSHAAFGYTMVRAVRPPMPGLAAAACLGALAPDADALSMPFGWDVYLRIHEVGTHALIGVVPVAFLVAIAVRGRSTRPIRPLFYASLFAVLSHLALDVVSGARIQIGWPFVSGRTDVPLVAMAEPWLIVLCVLGAATIAKYTTHARRAACVVLIALIFALTLKGVWLVQALNGLNGNSDNPAAMETRIVQSRWATLREWNVFGRSAMRFTHMTLTPGRAPRLVAEWPIDPDVALAMPSRRLDSVRNLLSMHELAFARVRRVENGATEVLWSDIRYCWQPPSDANDAPERGPLALGNGRARIACALWVGGTFDGSGRALNQRVQIFGLWQTRPTRP
jgi:membrane-bound metal-dependent hydrolase YbcI (DUF457 family)